MEPGARRPALVIVDLQARFAASDAAVHELAGRVGAFVDAHRDRYAFVAATQFRNHPESSYWRLVDHEMTTDEEVALLVPIASRADLVTETAAYSKFTDELRERIAAAGVSTVHVCGIDTDQCVLATVFDVFDVGLTPVVLADLCHSTSGTVPQQSGLIALRRAVGEERVVASDRVFG